MSKHDIDVEDDDLLVLTSQALAALLKFLSDQNKTVAGEDDSDKKVELVPEDWRLSQFWYEPETAETVAEEEATLSSRFSKCRVACTACPTLYVYVKYRIGYAKMLILLMMSEKRSKSPYAVAGVGYEA
ncbi:hypothetical protein Bca52824_008262 [Brassica carinata]|uniref:Uncharacterized protein n=1 Tax=Brassica carinata TaxID=52824 RepID=A0A8X7W9I8_BRACI|nr:hypothetical protein Bca52824_008262 [Brassica carinata]